MIAGGADAGGTMPMVGLEIMPMEVVLKTMPMVVVLGVERELQWQYGGDEMLEMLLQMRVVNLLTSILYGIQALLVPDDECGCGSWGMMRMIW